MMPFHLIEYKKLDKTIFYVMIVVIMSVIRQINIKERW